MNPLLLFYLLGLFDEHDDDSDMSEYVSPDMTGRDVVLIVLIGLGFGLGMPAIAWFIVSGRIGLGPFLTF